MKVAFRADASTLMGTGHVMRCLALADALKQRGDDCFFICRALPGNLFDLIRHRGHVVHALPIDTRAEDWHTDAARTVDFVQALEPRWLAVDHYQLDEAWESELSRFVDKLFVMDDIGRRHRCDLLLDQNLDNPVHHRYRESLGSATVLLLGPRFALLRAEFAALRQRALQRRDGSLLRLLVSMGGSDPTDETSKVLAGLSSRSLLPWMVDVVVGGSNPNIDAVEKACRPLHGCTLHVQTAKMAELMVAADCAISAGGSTTWERCCLGLPALVTVVSDDQVAVAEAGARAGVHKVLGRDDELSAEDYAQAVGALTAPELRAMAVAAAALCDGMGAGRVAEYLN